MIPPTVPHPFAAGPRLVVLAPRSLAVSSGEGEEGGW